MVDTKKGAAAQSGSYALSVLWCKAMKPGKECQGSDKDSRRQSFRCDYRIHGGLPYEPGRLGRLTEKEAARFKSDFSYIVDSLRGRRF